MQQLRNTPQQVFEEYRIGMRYKAGLGERGMYRQNEINRRFYKGDQWHGAACGSERPLVRHNMVRRIGEYKMSVVGAQPLAVNFFADGYTNTAWQREQTRALRAAGARGELPPLNVVQATDLTMSALSDYFRTSAERLRFDSLRERVLRDAYCTGTGVLYTYWDDTVSTGLFADHGQTVPIKGDIACEVLDIEQVYFGDPSIEEVQEQPYILIAQRRTVKELRRMAQRAGRSKAEIAAIRPDRDGLPPAGEPEEAGKALLITKFFKEQAEDGNTVVRAVQVCAGATVRGEWTPGIRLYPLAVFRWDITSGCAYGDSEIPWLIPNQIAVNRMLTSSVWAVLSQGMPTLLVNGDVIDDTVTNDPGQIIRVFGNNEDLSNAMRYVDPPAFSPALSSTMSTLVGDTLSQNGATAVALGDVDPRNTSAIVAVREAALLPLQMVKNRYFAFCEDVARVWAEFWVCNYGERPLRIQDADGVWYLPFNGEQYREMVIRAQVDVGAANLWSESQSIVTLDNLLSRGIITPKQYLKRLPHGIVPDIEGLIREQREEEFDDGSGSV